MKRAISTLESTVITIGIMLLDEVVADHHDVVDDKLVNLLKVARESLDNSHEFTLAWKAFCNQLDEMKLKEKKSDDH